MLSREQIKIILFVVFVSIFFTPLVTLILDKAGFNYEKEREDSPETSQYYPSGDFFPYACGDDWVKK